MDFYKGSVKEITKHFNTDTENGLNKSIIHNRLAKYGLNELEAKKKFSVIKLLLSQISDLLVIILIIAACISFFLGEFSDGVVILVIVLINTIVGFIQEFKAEKSIEALQNMVTPKARVIRDEENVEIESKYLVPGDILVLDEGDKIPCDARLFVENELKTDESSLTGESIPQKKTINVITSDKNVNDRKNMVFMGTNVSHGNGKAIVCNTGHDTEFGKIAKLTTDVKTEKSPLQKELFDLSKFIAKASVILVLLVFFGGVFFSKGDVFQMFLFAISMAVAIVPEGLPTIVTVGLSIGVMRMARKNAIIRKLSSVETLGCTTVICSDKTGTLTKNEMTVTEVYANNETIDITGIGYEPVGNFIHDGKKMSHDELDEYELMFNIAALTNNAELIHKKSSWKILGDPTEGALLVASKKLGINHKNLLFNYPKIHEIPFDSIRKRMITIHSHKKKNYAYMKGAFDEVIKLCSYIQIDGKVRKLNSKDKEKVVAKNLEMAKKGMRVLATSYKKIGDDHSVNCCEKNMVFVGLIAMIDPPRKGVKQAVEMARLAGIRTIVITGDFGLTAKAIAKQVSICSDDCKIINGTQLDKMGEEELKDILKNQEVLFARASPENKLRIVKCLESMREVVAVTGDGVNDAPALKKASIGVAMGMTGTDVSKEASNMILSDDSFVSIISAIKEGRTIYNNLKKFITYVLSGNIGELFTVLLALVMQIPLPLLAIQILLIDLGTEVLPSLALAVDPSDKNIMSRKPRNTKEKIMNSNMIVRLLMVGLILGFGSLWLFIDTLSTYGLDAFGGGEIVGTYAYLKATTMVFATITFFQMVNAFNCRDNVKSFYKIPFFTNKIMFMAVGLSIGMLLCFIYIPFFNNVLHTTPLGVYDWLKIFILSFTIHIADEIRKYFLRLKNASNS